MSQESEILKWLLRGYCITPLDALRLFESMRLASRINTFLYVERKKYYGEKI